MTTEVGRAGRFSPISCALVCVLIPVSQLQVSEKFAFSLFDLDWDVFMQHIQGAINRVPVLERTGIKSTVCGPGNAVPGSTNLLPSGYGSQQIGLGATKRRGEFCGMSWKCRS